MSLKEDMTGEEATALINAEFDRVANEKIDEVAQETHRRVMTEKLQPLLSDQKFIRLKSTVTVMAYEDFGASDKTPIHRAKKWICHPIEIKAGTILKYPTADNGEILTSFEKEDKSPYHMLRITITDELIEALEPLHS